MSKLNKLVGKGKEIELGKEEKIKIEIKPLTVSSLPLFMQMDKDPGVIKDIIAITLKNSVPDATDEEIDKISIEYAVSIMEAIMEVNQLEASEGNKDFLDKMKKRQNVGRTAESGNKKGTKS